MEEEVIELVKGRMRTLLFDEAVTHYREHETFVSRAGKVYQFLVWKLPKPENWEQFSGEMQALTERDGYECIPGACDVSTCYRDTKACYKVVALYKVSHDQNTVADK